MINISYEHASIKFLLHDRFKVVNVKQKDVIPKECR